MKYNLKYKKSDYISLLTLLFFIVMLVHIPLLDKSSHFVLEYCSAVHYKVRVESNLHPPNVLTSCC